MPVEPYKYSLDENAPVVGLTSFWNCINKRTYDSLGHYYSQSVLRAGGAPLIIPVVEDASVARRYIRSIDALILSGGADVDPWLYGQTPHPELKNITMERDHMEIALLKEALNQGKPVLGICRGVQLMNIAQGGDLYQRVNAQVEGSMCHYADDTEMHVLLHTITVEPGSRLMEILGSSEVRVNSFHRQSVRNVAKGFKASAHAPDGVIEAIEASDGRFVVGVQWHPEALTAQMPQHLALFKALVDEAGK